MLMVFLIQIIKGKWSSRIGRASWQLQDRQCIHNPTTPSLCTAYLPYMFAIDAHGAVIGLAQSMRATDSR